MKRLIYLLFAGVFFIACNNQENTAEAPKNTDLIQDNLKGKVQRYEQTSYAVDSTGKMGEMDSIITTQNYDEKGYQTSFTDKNKAGEVTTEGTVTRYDNGATKTFESKEKGKTTFKIELELDSSGKYIRGNAYDSTGNMSSYYTGLSENEFGEVLTGTQYNMDGTIKSSFANNYDEQGHYIGGSGKDSTGKETFHATVKLNDKGDPVERTTMNVGKDSTTTTTVTYTYDSYDDAGNWTQRTTVNDKGKPTKIVKRTFTYYKD